MTYNCKQPYYSVLDNSQINVTWEHHEFGSIPFTADSSGVTPVGTQIFEEAQQGKYGIVVSFKDSHWYCTANNNFWEGRRYDVGDLMISPTGTQPPNSTDQPIPVPPYYLKLS